jgi:hypothetical protein
MVFACDRRDELVLTRLHDTHHISDGHFSSGPVRDIGQVLGEGKCSDFANIGYKCVRRTVPAWREAVNTEQNR